MGVAHFKIVHDDGRFHWQLMNPQGTPMFRSTGTFDTQDEALANAEDARRLIGQAPITPS
jgi:hypothetical protein